MWKILARKLLTKPVSGFASSLIKRGTLIVTFPSFSASLSASLVGFIDIAWLAVASELNQHRRPAVLSVSFLKASHIYIAYTITSLFVLVSAFHSDDQ